MGNGIVGTAAVRTSQQQLVDYLQTVGHFTKPRVRAALLAIDRGDFAPRLLYEDRPQVILLFL